MAYCNVNQFTAKRLAKVRNITNCDQIDKNFKLSAYLAWNNADFFRDNPKPVGIESRPPPEKIVDRKNKNRQKIYRGSFSSTLDTGQSPSEFDMDLTLIPANNSISSNDNDTNFNKNSNNGLSSNSEFDTILANNNNTINIEEIFPAPDVIIKDLFELYKGNKPVKERDSALLDYVKLLFNKFNV